MALVSFGCGGGGGDTSSLSLSPSSSLALGFVSGFPTYSIVLTTFLTIFGFCCSLACCAFMALQLCLCEYVMVFLEIILPQSSHLTFSFLFGGGSSTCVSSSSSASSSSSSSSCDGGGGGGGGGGGSASASGFFVLLGLAGFFGGAGGSSVTVGCGSSCGGSLFSDSLVSWYASSISTTSRVVFSVLSALLYIYIYSRNFFLNLEINFD